jgi:hypothetical protein
MTSFGKLLVSGILLVLAGVAYAYMAWGPKPVALSLDPVLYPLYPSVQWGTAHTATTTDGSAETGDAVEASRPIGAAAREQERRPWKRPEPAPAPVTTDTRNAELAKLMAVVKANNLHLAIPTEGGKARTGTVIPPDMVKAVEATNIEYHRTPDGQNYVLPGDLEPRQVAMLRGLYEQQVQAVDAGAALGNAPAPAISKP